MFYQKNEPNRPVPTVTFEDTYTLEVGNQRLELAIMAQCMSQKIFSSTHQIRKYRCWLM